MDLIVAVSYNNNIMLCRDVWNVFVSGDWSIIYINEGMIYFFVLSIYFFIFLQIYYYIKIQKYLKTCEVRFDYSAHVLSMRRPSN